MKEETSCTGFYSTGKVATNNTGYHKKRVGENTFIFFSQGDTKTTQESSGSYTVPYKKEKVHFTNQILCFVNINKYIKDH